MTMNTKFMMSFAIHGPNENRREAFGAKNNGEGYAWDNLHVMMEIYGVEILIGPGEKIAMGYDSGFNCEIRYTDEKAFHKAYKVLSREETGCSIKGPYLWANKLGLLTDKFGIPWALYLNDN